MPDPASDTQAARPLAVVILAAGQGTRMRSPLPKVLHALAGRPMLDRAIDAAQGLGAARIVVVAGAHSPAVAAHVRARLGEDAAAIIAEATTRFAAEPDGEAGGAVAFLCPRENAAELADFLLSKGARRVSVSNVEQVFQIPNPLYDALESKALAE